MPKILVKFTASLILGNPFFNNATNIEFMPSKKSMSPFAVRFTLPELVKRFSDIAPAFGMLLNHIIALFLFLKYKYETPTHTISFIAKLGILEKRRWLFRTKTDT
jgi:hypothetical protein